METYSCYQCYCCFIKPVLTVLLFLFLQEKENKTDYKDDMKALTLQIENLVTKLSEMQSDLKKKDDKIKTLRKMVKKSGSDGKGKIYESVQVLV